MLVFLAEVESMSRGRVPRGRSGASMVREVSPGKRKAAEQRRRREEKAWRARAGEVETRQMTIEERARMS